MEGMGSAEHGGPIRKVTRTTLFSAAWAVKVEPPVCVWKRSIQLLGFLAQSVFHDMTQLAAPALNFRHFHEEVVVRVKRRRKGAAEFRRASRP